MNDPRIAMIWAQATNGVIGAGGDIPWHLPEDFRHFRELTAGQPVIMGRRTWDSLPEKSRPLPGRPNIVITGQDAWAADGALRASSLSDALSLANGAAGPGERLWVIGGGRIYAEAMSVAGTAVITVIDKDVDGDTFAPELGAEWSMTAVEPATAWYEGANGTRYRFETWSHA
ncbi:MAG TPA: dihydrofolate reductase [Arthrobacter sp.]